MTAKPQPTSILSAVLIALTLVIQTLGTAYASGLGGEPVLVDAFGNPLCITSGEHGSPSGDGKHAALTDCCTLACAAAAQTAGTPPDLVAVKLPDERRIARIWSTLFSGVPAARLWSPGNPRAPPLAM